MKTPEEHLKSAVELKTKLDKEAKEWQQPFLDLCNYRFQKRDVLEMGEIKLWRELHRGKHCFRMECQGKDVGLKEKFLCFDMYRLSLTQEEALQALAEFKTLGEFVSFSLVNQPSGAMS
jgi:hypothetical protein